MPDVKKPNIDKSMVESFLEEAEDRFLRKFTERIHRKFSIFNYSEFVRDAIRNENLKIESILSDNSPQTVSDRD